jgi:hypothetical protein
MPGTPPAREPAPLPSEDAFTRARRGNDLFVRVLDQAPEKREAFPLARKVSTTYSTNTLVLAGTSFLLE